MQPDNLPPIQPPEPPRPPVPGFEPTDTASDQAQFLGYDASGHPLYGTPNPPQAANTMTQSTVSDQEPRVVHISRAPAPVAQMVPDEVKARHDESVAKYPGLNLSEAEYIISAVDRHPIGMVMPIIVGIVLIVVILAAAICYPFVTNSLGIAGAPEYNLVLLIALLLSMLIGIGVYVTTWIYRANQFYLTNESVIQEIQTSLFAKREQTVSLGNIEDASFHQDSMLETMFDYGSIRLSTEGDETTYRFSYVAKPKQQIAILNNAVEAFKNGRPITDSDN